MPQAQYPSPLPPQHPSVCALCPLVVTAAKTERTRRVSVVSQVGQATPPTLFSGVAWRTNFSKRVLHSGQKYSYIGIGRLPSSFRLRNVLASVATAAKSRQQNDTSRIGI
jgi:hypothetical protein